MSFHIADETLQAYLAGTIAPASAWSVEAHVTDCAPCRQRVMASQDVAPSADRLAAIWDDVEDVLDVPNPTVLERLLVAVRVPDHLARLLVATPALTGAWLLAVGTVAVLLGGLALAAPDHRTDLEAALPFLALAPLLPVVGVGLAFGAWADPTHELGVAAPMSGLRLLLVRMVAVLATTMPLVAAGALLLPGFTWASLAWVLPSLALSVVSLALSTWVLPQAAVAAVSIVWLAATAATELLSSAELATFRAPGQVIAAVLLVVAATTLHGRRERLDRVVWS